MNFLHLFILNSLAKVSNLTVATRADKVMEKLIENNETLFVIYDEKCKDYTPKLHNIAAYWNLDYGDFLTSINNNFLTQNYVIFLNDEERIYLLIKILRKKFLQNGSKIRSDKFYLFTSSCCNKTQIFQTFWKEDIVNVILFELDEYWKPYTYHPFTEDSRCGKIILPKPIDVTKFAFEVKNLNLKYCTFNVSCVDVELTSESFYEVPYTFTSPLVILKEKYQLNFTLFSMPIDYQKNPLIKTPQMKRELINKEYDGIAVIPAREFEHIVTYDKKVELSNILFTDQFMWIVPKPEKLPNIKIFLNIFPIDILLYCFVTTIVLMIVWIFILKVKGNEGNVTGLVAVTLGYGFGNLPRLNLLKFLLMFYLFYSMHVTYFFQGSLSSKLLLPQYEKKIKTMEQLIDSKYSMQLVDAERQLLFPSDNPLEQRLYKKVYNSPGLEPREDNCKRIILDGHKSVTIRNNFLASTYDEECAIYMDILADDLSPFLVYTYAIRLGHPILSFINKAIERIQEHGFANKWIYSKVRRTSYKLQEIESSSLTMEHFQAIFFLLFIGLFSGLLSFICEIYKKKSKTFNYVNTPQ